MQHQLMTTGAIGMRYGSHHDAIRLLGVVVHWLLVPLEAGLALWGSLLVAALAGWTIWSAVWLVRRATMRVRIPFVAVRGDGPAT